MEQERVSILALAALDSATENTMKVMATALLIGASLVGAQPTPPTVLKVGDSRVDASRLQPYTARWKETIVNAIHQVVERGTWEDSLTYERINGRDVLVRLIVVTQPDGSMRERYRTVVDGRTFAPVRSEWENNQGLSYAYDYAMPAATGVRVNTKGGAPVTIAANLGQPAFDYYGGVMELFLATLPRQPGAVFTFPAALTTSGYDANQSGIDWPTVQVFPEEMTRGAGGAPVKATRMEANTKYGFYKVWVTDTPPFVVRTVLLLAPGGRITYELM